MLEIEDYYVYSIDYYIYSIVHNRRLFCVECLSLSFCMKNQCSLIITKLRIKGSTMIIVYDF